MRVPAPVPRIQNRRAKNYVYSSLGLSLFSVVLVIALDRTLTLIGATEENIVIGMWTATGVVGLFVLITTINTGNSASAPHKQAQGRKKSTAMARYQSLPQDHDDDDDDDDDEGKEKQSGRSGLPSTRDKRPPDLLV